ncbi:MAG: RagB/SusD family nutrient uptake outer membrane protein [Tannerella sp.]|jgi:hypothetical protein|nr:RagB/SusD family nutrient uptake outer membrane protein [Tannerella sp.]
MKNIKYLLLSMFLGLTFSSCETLDLEPKGILDDAALLGTEEGIKMYVAGLYDYLPIEDFNYSPTSGYRWGNYWEAQKQYMGAMCGEVVGWQGGLDGASGFSYWPYDRIRRVNTLIEKLPSVKSKYTEATYNSVIGEAHFLRAYFYFGLAKRYGGMPLVDVVQDPFAPADELNVFRATESEMYRFIQNDLKFAMDNMATTAEKGRATKYVAAALMSRAMLYAGRIAKYGGYTTSSPDVAAQKGYVGIPASEASYFFNEAVSAAKFVEAGDFELVGENLAHSAKEQNFVDMFLKETKEDVYVKYFSTTAPGGAQLNHSWDGSTTPSGRFSSWPGSEIYPTLETVELYQQMPVENEDGTPRRFENREDMWQGFEPRLLATVYFHGMPLRGNTFDIRRGFYRSYNGTMEDAAFGVTTAPINAASNRIIATNSTQQHEGVAISGRDGAWNGGTENNTTTGFFVRKYVDYNMSAAQAGGYGSQTAFKVFRFAEMLLNHAEAAYELGNKQEAYDLIARVRNRAGAAVWAPKAAPGEVYMINNQVVDENLQYIRDERFRELLLEQQRWWDIRTWRVADKYLNQFRPLALLPYLVLDENKYIFIKEYNITNKQYTFNVRNFYDQVPTGQISRNQNLVQNPIY